MGHEKFRDFLGWDGMGRDGIEHYFIAFPKIVNWLCPSTQYRRIENKLHHFIPLVVLDGIIMHFDRYAF